MNIQNLLNKYESDFQILQTKNALRIYADICLKYHAHDKLIQKELFDSLLRKIHKKKGFYPAGRRRQISGIEVLFAYCYIENINPLSIYYRYLNHIKRDFVLLERYERFCKKNNLFNIFNRVQVCQ